MWLLCVIVVAGRRGEVNRWKNPSSSSYLLPHETVGVYINICAHWTIGYIYIYTYISAHNIFTFQIETTTIYRVYIELPTSQIEPHYYFIGRRGCFPHIPSHLPSGCSLLKLRVSGPRGVRTVDLCCFRTFNRFCNNLPGVWEGR